MSKFSWFNGTSLTLGFGFLYLPILLLVIYSFNASSLVTVWGGWSLKWYGELMRDPGILNAAWVSVRVALISATVATFLGTLAAIALVRYRNFRGRTLFTGMIYTPLIMPEVITGLSLLLLFTATGIGKNFWSVVIAHITFGTAFATVVISSRLVGLDKSLEEAAMDLGCSASSAFVKVVLPVIAPGLAAAWLLAFSLSLDDVVIANFVAGPGGTTLPVKVFSQVRQGVTPEINALAAILVGAVTLGVISAGIISKMSEARSHATSN